VCNYPDDYDSDLVVARLRVKLKKVLKAKEGSVGKSTIIKAAELTLGHKTREEVRKPRVTDEMIDMMEERRKWKSKRRPQKYKSPNNLLRWITEKARENGGMNSVQNWRNMRQGKMSQLTNRKREK